MIEAHLRTYPVYHLIYSITSGAKRHALVAAERPSIAKTLLEDYLLKDSAASLPDGTDVNSERLDYAATRRGVIFCSAHSRILSENSRPIRGRSWWNPCCS